jgi:hypothetical protein
MQKQLEKSATSSTDQKSKAPSSSNEEKNDYRNVPPPHKFSDTAYDEQKKQIADDMNEAVQIAAELIQAEKLKKKKKISTEVSTRDDDEKETISKKRRHSEDTLEDGEVKNKKTKQKETGATGAFFLGIDLGDVSSDDEEEEEEIHQSSTKKKMVKKT